jgi:hypothetical protein
VLADAACQVVRRQNKTGGPSISVQMKRQGKDAFAEWVGWKMQGGKNRCVWCGVMQQGAQMKRVGAKWRATQGGQRNKTWTEEQNWEVQGAHRELW